MTRTIQPSCFHAVEVVTRPVATLVLSRLDSLALKLFMFAGTSP
jgi:hypothetical protein